MQTSDWVTAVTTGATVLSVFIAGYALWRQLSFLRRQMAIQHFSDYARRYAEVIERLPERIHEPTCRLDDFAATDDVMPILRGYFSVCFEEWYLHERGYFDHGMWDLWCEGLRNLLKKPAVREAWERIANDTDYGPGFVAFMERFAARSTSPSP